MIWVRIVFCDNNRQELELLESYVREFFEKLGGISPEFASYLSGSELLEKEKFVDFAFLDVEMPCISGIQVGNRLKEHNSEVKIFIVTAYPDYLDEAMNLQVFRFLSKPLDKERLQRNLKEALYRYNMFSKKILIKTKSGAYAADSKDIVTIESSGRRSLVNTVNGTIECSDGIEAWKERLLPIPCFYQSHRAFIINLRYVYRLEPDTVTLKYAEKERTAYLAKRKYSDLTEKFMLFLESTK